MKASPALRPHPTLPTYYADEHGRRRFVARIFDETAGEYDWIIRAMSLGSGGLYRRQALRRAGLAAGMRVLDVACGTGAVSRAALAIAGAGAVLGVDPTPGMLRECRRRARIPVLRATAERLPVPDARFDFLSMGYALRHVHDLNATFTEFRRVLAPGGRLLVLELTRPRSALGRRLAELYLRRLVPWLAARRGGEPARTLMRYFWDTIEHCVPPETILSSARAAGFERVELGTRLGLFSEYRAERSARGPRPGPGMGGA